MPTDIKQGFYTCIYTSKRKAEDLLCSQGRISKYVMVNWSVKFKHTLRESHGE